MPVNGFKAAIAAGGAQIGLCMGLADACAAELCAGAGFDWLLIDAEHAPNDLRLVLGALQAVAPYPSQPVLRLANGDPALIKQVLEIGVTSLLVPMVDTAEQARELVRAMRYPPAGIRGVGSRPSRSSRWGAQPDYLQHADGQLCLLVQVESAAALARVEAIAAVDGVDGVFIAPEDLCASMGYRGQTAHPQVRAAIDSAIDIILDAGKAPGILAVDEVQAHHYIEVGARFVAVGVEISLLAKATRELARRFKHGRLSRPA